MTSNGKSASAQRASIAAHPLFPAIVALWFAALLGFGSLILPEALFERFGIVDTSMRGAIALIAAVGGAGLGVVLARKVAAAPAPARPRARSVAADSKRPILATEELGPEGFDEPVGEVLPPESHRWSGPFGQEQLDDRVDFAPLPHEEEDWQVEPEAVAISQWDVEADEPEQVQGAADEPPVYPVTGLAARPLAELSMVELVERFALALRNAPVPETQRETQRYDEVEPVALFPGQRTRPAAPHTTETALRDALAQLQRVGGAA